MPFCWAIQNVRNLAFLPIKYKEPKKQFCANIPTVTYTLIRQSKIFNKGNTVVKVSSIDHYQLYILYYVLSDIPVFSLKSKNFTLTHVSQISINTKTKTEKNTNIYLGKCFTMNPENDFPNSNGYCSVYQKVTILTCQVCFYIGCGGNHPLFWHW